MVAELGDVAPAARPLVLMEQQVGVLGLRDLARTAADSTSYILDAPLDSRFLDGRISRFPGTEVTRAATIKLLEGPQSVSMLPLGEGESRSPGKQKSDTRMRSHALG